MNRDCGQSYLESLRQRLSCRPPPLLYAQSRMGAPKAITATAHKLARIIYHLMRYGGDYTKQQEEAYAAEVKARQERQLHRRAKELGYELKKVKPKVA
ncbi:MAG: hypothetical protein R3B84_16560 [Zavarzinella sp.]